MNFIAKYFNFWVLVGFLGQFIFFMRFVVQWLASEKEKKVVIPMLFWYLSIIGTLVIMVYSIVRKDIVFSVASFLNFFIYARNVWIAKRTHK